MGTEAVGWVLRQNIKDPLAKLVLIGLADCFHDKTGECFPGKGALMEVAPCSQDCLKKKLSYLEREGWIRRIRRFDPNGRQTTNSYEIMFERGITREEYARQQAEKREAKKKKTRGAQKAPTKSEVGGDSKAPGVVTPDTPRGVTTSPPLTTTNEQRGAHALISKSSKRSGASGDAEDITPAQRAEVGARLRGLLKQMKGGSDAPYRT